MSLVLVALEPAPNVDPECAANDKRLEETIENLAHGKRAASSFDSYCLWDEGSAEEPEFKSFKWITRIEWTVSTGQIVKAKRGFPGDFIHAFYYAITWWTGSDLPPLIFVYVLDLRSGASAIAHSLGLPLSLMLFSTYKWC